MAQVKAPADDALLRDCEGQFIGFEQIASDEERVAFGMLAPEHLIGNERAGGLDEAIGIGTAHAPGCKPRSSALDKLSIADRILAQFAAAHVGRQEKRDRRFPLIGEQAVEILSGEHDFHHRLGLQV